jgi:hypothetical protein
MALTFAWHGEPLRAGQKLSASQIMSMFPGTFEAVYDDDTTIIIHATLDGGLSGRIGMLSDTGRWGLDGDRICIRWDNWLGSRMKCRFVEYANGWYLTVASDGQSPLRLRRAS